MSPPIVQDEYQELISRIYNRLKSNPVYINESKGIKRDVHLKFIFRDLKKKIFNELVKTQKLTKITKPLLQCSLDEWKVLLFSLIERLNINISS